MERFAEVPYELSIERDPAGSTDGLTVMASIVSGSKVIQ